MCQEHPNSATYRGFILDSFQQQALDYIEQGRSVIVSAPTGLPYHLSPSAI